MNVIDLFCGCGGMSLGFMNAGFNLVAAFDNWKLAIDVYRLNFSHPVFEYDLCGYDKDCDIFKQFDPYMIIGGPPCQDFSSAGKRDEHLGRADLTVSFAEIISIVKPTWFVMENVSRIQKSDALIRAKQIFVAAGYGLSQKILDASLCGVPQRRKRFFIIGEMDGKDGSILPVLESNLSCKSMTVREHLGEQLDIEFYYRHPRSYKRRAVFSIDEPSPTIRGVNRPIPSGYTGHPGDLVKISPKVRSLTTEERQVIQTFPKEFKFVGSKTTKEQLIGNAVPVNLACYVANCIIKYISITKLN